VFKVEGTPNESGAILEVAELILRYKEHAEQTFFAVTKL
jgi:hypothetical protein